ncbi:DeoR/GlpR family DNA-binding transcription regulator [Agrilactobacillus yilanensis]|uniref:Lactose phosphotransferase system repressor n=1 Tax=Agrilactobacillus yilanensis TaxID=2485997 RepID=A0ABW4J543_9LACO|nr:DeoR/GlpR family DNA-binding transcription regulator [Agrilactobacillus yilanensis]
MNKRIDDLLQIVNQQQKIEVNELAQQLNVSKVTIRKDLTALEKKGLLRRQHGYAVINNPNDLNYRLAQNYEVKLKIAQAAADMVQDQATIMIESGSTCALLAEALGKQGKHVTIITISYFIANYVAQYTNLDVFVLGGKYQPDAQVVVGPLAKAVLANFRVTNLFIGTDGFDPTAGFFGNDIMRTDTVQAMAANAQKLIILTDATKFTQPSLVHQFSLPEVDTVITDQSLPAATAAVLAKNEVTVVKVAANA